MEELILSIKESPQDWVVSEFYFKHKSGFRFWTANGFLSFGPYESSMTMSFMQKIRTWSNFRWWCSNCPVDSCN